MEHIMLQNAAFVQAKPRTPTPIDAVIDIEKLSDQRLLELNARVQFEMKTRQDKKDQENKYQASGLADLCRICMNKPSHVALMAFACGHVACELCAVPLTTCPFCKTVILRKQKLFI